MPRNRQTAGVSLRAPVILLILAATAIPVELQPVRHLTVDFDISTGHLLANVAGYVPLGIVLGEFGVLRAVIVAALMSASIEASQLLMLYRHCSATDLATNVLGAFLGALICVRWKIGSPILRIGRWRALIAAAGACTIILLVWGAKAPPTSARGATTAGTLEADWKLDESGGRVALDSSGHGLNGRFSGEPKHVEGVTGRAVMFNGKKDSIDFGRSTALRLSGSMTISAWIKPSSFPRDDAAIVSQFQGGFGYQLDTTVDEGPRTVGFKLTNVCGELMARYGATPLAVNTWYHAAGVYDAGARTLHVYLNGRLDDGPLRGVVTGTQHSSRSAVYVGRRSDQAGFEFAGAIEDVRIYSLALTNAEIAAVMQGKDVDVGVHGAPENSASSAGAAGSIDPGAECAVISQGGDENIPMLAASLGVLAAFACLGLLPWTGSEGPHSNSEIFSSLALFSSLASGLLLLPATAHALPSFNLWLIPLVSLGGGASVVFSLRWKDDPAGANR